MNWKAIRKVWCHASNDEIKPIAGLNITIDANDGCIEVGKHE